ncbi:hypothetical protein Q1695_003862 [Nippostrongylus brasiliensis]|nr:hypothetical protein Q1695_003862 [Nippostrongylus brasiliensis]
MTPSSILTGAAKARYVFPQEKFMFVAFTTSHSFVRFVYAIFSQEGERLDAALKECKAEVDMTTTVSVTASKDFLVKSRGADAGYQDVLK